MEMDNQNLDILYKICATLKYNTERIPILETILKNFLIKFPKEFDIKREVSKLNKKRKNELKLTTISSEYLLSKHFFAGQDFLLSSSILFTNSLDYVQKRYFSYNQIFKKKYGFDISLLSLVSMIITELMVNKAKKLNFKGETYCYETKEEYIDLGFIAYPDNEFIQKWSKIITFYKKEILSWLLKKMDLYKEQFSVTDMKINFNEFRKSLDFVLNLYTFNIPEIRKNQKIRFPDKPILKVIDDKFIILAPKYLLNYLPQKHHLLLKQCKEYRENKGKYFENIALNLLRNVPDCKLDKNIKYNKNELDGFLNLSKSSWFVECSSHPPDIKSLLGEIVNIKRDIEKTIKKCQQQAMKAIDNITHPNIAKLKPKKNQGIIIILEGIFPNLNSNTILNVVPFKKDIPRYIINYFDLQEILRQPDIYLFEEFLLWRTQKEMPIICLDELDYWAFFTQMKIDKKTEQIFKIAKKKNIHVIYNSHRFNKKDYLKKIARG